MAQDDVDEDADLCDRNECTNAYCDCECDDRHYADIPDRLCVVSLSACILDIMDNWTSCVFSKSSLNSRQRHHCLWPKWKAAAEIEGFTGMVAYPQRMRYEVSPLAT